MRPSLRYRMLPSSSVLCQAGSNGSAGEREGTHTGKSLFDLVENQIHQLVVALEGANDCGETS